MSSKSKIERMRALRIGQLLAMLESALAALKGADRCHDLLEETDRNRLQSAYDTLQGIEQRVWEHPILK